MDEKLEYYVTFRWMTAVLGLKGSELQVYALIHGFSQGEQGCYFGSLQHIADVCGFSKNTAQNALKALVDKGLLRKQKVTINNVEMCQYTACSKAIPKFGIPYQNLGEGIPKIGMGGIPKIGTNNKSSSDNKKDKVSEPLSLPFSSQKFIDTWNALCEEKNWKGKTQKALQLTLNKLGRYHEDFAIELMEKAIEGGWKGVVFADTDAKYQEWQSARNHAADSAVQRTARVKPRELPPGNNIDQMYARLRQQREEEERAMREELERRRNGNTD